MYDINTSIDANHAVTRLERTVQYFFLASVFCVSFSTALTNFFAGMTLIGFLLALLQSRALRAGLRSPPGLFALGLLVIFIVATSWSIAPQADMITALKKYARLLILPISIALCWRDPALTVRALKWTLAGSLVLAAASYLVWLGLMPSSDLGWWRIGTEDDAFAFKNHITLGILLGFAALVCFLRATYSKTTPGRLLAIAAGIFFTVPIIFLNQGRTGYVTLFIGLVVVYLLRGRVTPLRTIAALAGIAALFAGFYATSDNLRSRTDALIAEVRADDQRSPNGQRISYMQVGMQIVAANPLTGVGTGAFAEAYAPTARNLWPAGTVMATDRHQPHSEFLLVVVQLGLLGLLPYFGMLAAIARPAFAVRSFETDTLILLWTIYVFASSFNSLLWDTTEAYWFLLLSGPLYVTATRAAARPRG